MSSALYTVDAYSFESRFVLRDAVKWLPLKLDLEATRPSKTQLFFELAPDRFLIAFDFGALVFVNVSEDEQKKIVTVFETNLPPEPHAPLRENFLVEVRDNASIEVKFDRVILPSLTNVSVNVLATVLAQSVAIDYYDEDVEAILGRIETIAHDVAERGRPLGRTKDLIRFVGASIASQIETIAAISLLDKPDMTWEDETADRLHDKLRNHLEITERYKALEVKLMTIRESIQTLLELSSTRRMLFLEAAIVILIVLEILIGFLKLH